VLNSDTGAPLWTVVETVQTFAGRK